MCIFENIAHFQYLIYNNNLANPVGIRMQKKLTIKKNNVK